MASEAPAGLAIELGPSGLEIDPGSTREVEIEVTPAGVYEVTLAVVGEGNGAFLNQDHFSTDEDGRASVMLTVPFETPNFELQASVFDETSRLSVGVGRALGTIVVEPVYNGQRETDAWIVSVGVEQESCLDDRNYENGASFTQGRRIVLSNVPATAPVQIFARARHYVYGCSENVVLLPGIENVVRLTLTDRSIQLAELDMEFAFSFEQSTEFSGALSTIVSDMVTAFRSTAADDAAGLLQAMSQVYAVRVPTFGSPRFDVAAEERSWAAEVRQHFQTQSEQENPLSQALTEWLEQGTAQLFTDSSFFQGRLSADSSEAPGLFTLENVGPLTPTQALMEEGFAVVVATTNDRLSAGFEMTFRPSRLLAELARDEAGVDTLIEVAALLEEEVDCSLLAEALVRRSPDPVEPLPQCDPGCLAQTCTDALAFMWTQAQQAAPAERSLVISAAGDALLDEHARPVAFAGSWAGETDLLGSAEFALPLRGPFAAGAADGSH